MGLEQLVQGYQEAQAQQMKRAQEIARQRIEASQAQFDRMQADREHEYKMQELQTQLINAKTAQSRQEETVSHNLATEQLGKDKLEEEKKKEQRRLAAQAFKETLDWAKLKQNKGISEERIRSDYVKRARLQGLTAPEAIKEYEMLKLSQEVDQQNAEVQKSQAEQQAQEVEKLQSFTQHLSQLMQGLGNGDQANSRLPLVDTKIKKGEEETKLVQDKRDFYKIQRQKIESDMKLSGLKGEALKQHIKESEAKIKHLQVQDQYLPQKIASEIAQHTAAVNHLNAMTQESLTRAQKISVEMDQLKAGGLSPAQKTGLMRQVDSLQSKQSAITKQLHDVEGNIATYRVLIESPNTPPETKRALQGKIVSMADQADSLRQEYDQYAAYMAEYSTILNEAGVRKVTNSSGKVDTRANNANIRAGRQEANRVQKKVNSKSVPPAPITPPGQTGKSNLKAAPKLKKSLKDMSEEELIKALGKK